MKQSLHRSLPRIISVVLLILLAAACSKEEEKKVEEPAVLKPVDTMTGEALFDARCRQCHTVLGKGGVVGPDLTHTYSQKSREYLEQVIREPSKLYPGTIMPAFNGQLSSEQLDSLIDYLDTSKPLPWKQRKKHRWQKDKDQQP
jgi:L-cysteine S-thiosulfotransferase